MNADNSALGPAPLSTVITTDGDDLGVPYQSRGVPRGNLHTVWGQWFNRLTQFVLGLQTVSSLQADLATLAATLTAANAGQLVWVSDYAHMLQWNGTGWQRGQGDTEHSDTFHMFGAAPADTGWLTCDGSTAVKFLKYDGTLGSRDLPNLNATAAYAKLGNAYSATGTAPVLPTANTTVPAATSTPATVVGSVAGVGVTTTPATVVGSVSGGGGVNIAATVTLPGDPIENFPVICWYRQ